MFLRRFLVREKKNTRKMIDIDIETIQVSDGSSEVSHVLYYNGLIGIVFASGSVGTYRIKDKQMLSLHRELESMNVVDCELWTVQSKGGTQKKGRFIRVS